MDLRASPQERQQDDIHFLKNGLVQETTSWDDKEGELTLVDIIMVIRRTIWEKMYFSMSENHENNARIPQCLRGNDKLKFSILVGNDMAAPRLTLQGCFITLLENIISIIMP
ncbi:TPA: hypothetical protein ACP9DH_002904 [Legionella anisa]